MADQAKVTSLDALDSLRAASIIFMTKARTAVDQGSDEVRRARYWLEHDRRPHWESQLKRRTANLHRAEQELLSAKYSEFNDTQTMQRSAVRKAKEAVVEAEDKLRRIKGWLRNFDTSFDPLTKKLDVLRQYLDNDLPKAVAHIVQIQRTLESYAEVSPLHASAPPAADLPLPETPDEKPPTA
ncbi:hypothetical protein DES53_11185 [Roseimicrobium gellanilyticum]|uniref:Uncharacterized protein n=1 Tax=Roseimicrobium gellanilyticum TaxID=748857 RepID=A0A366H9R5_9BACT|nr:hypothetical protein [Roseimicrobium gellanilyticum]RBP38567.1 hypothetical protein DES53_11185 [Roseimicrobium gellanilyticum]